ncbi:unnamed protein product [Ixodes persulcatus]
MRGAVRWRRCLLVALVAGACVSTFLIGRYVAADCHGRTKATSSDGTDSPQPPDKGPVKLAVVTCGDRLNITLTNLKSAVAFSRARLHLYLYSDDANFQLIQDGISQWPARYLERISYDVRPVKFPDEASGKWTKTFMLCSSLRLFLPSMLPDDDAVLYVDSDIVFLRPVEELWSYLGAMDSQQMVAMAPHAEDANVSAYTRYAKHPFVLPYGVNAGLILMNLTRMRNFGWESRLEPMYEKYNRPFGDQALVNIVLHFFPEKLMMLSCKWNFRRLNSFVESTCDGDTPALVHGTGHSFTWPEKMPAIRAVFLSMLKYKLGTSLEQNFVEPLERRLLKVPRTVCRQRFLRQLNDWRQLAIDTDEYQGTRPITVPPYKNFSSDSGPNGNVLSPSV